MQLPLFPTNSNYVKTIECFDTLIETQPCLQNDRERIMEIIKGLFSGVTDIMCGNDCVDWLAVKFWY